MYLTCEFVPTKIEVLSGKKKRSGSGGGVKISQYYDFGWEQNRSLSFQFPKLYAIQMPAEVVNFQKQKEKV